MNTISNNKTSFYSEQLLTAQTSSTSCQAPERQCCAMPIINPGVIYGCTTFQRHRAKTFQVNKSFSSKGFPSARNFCNFHINLWRLKHNMKLCDGVCFRVYYSFKLSTHLYHFTWEVVTVLRVTTVRSHFQLMRGLSADFVINWLEFDLVRMFFIHFADCC